MNIGKVIREERKRQRYGLVSFAKMVGLSTAGLALIEKGLVQGKKETIEAIANKLGFPVVYFMVASIEESDVKPEVLDEFESLRGPMMELIKEHI